MPCLPSGTPGGLVFPYDGLTASLKRSATAPSVGRDRRRVNLSKGPWRGKFIRQALKVPEGKHGKPALILEPGVACASEHAAEVPNLPGRDPPAQMLQLLALHGNETMDEALRQQP